MSQMYLKNIIIHKLVDEILQDGQNCVDLEAADLHHTRGIPQVFQLGQSRFESWCLPLQIFGD